tara:strand:- start:266 stop:454 length:189 start_codon:yes stop_codon:yes gene_type:complete
MKVGTLLEELSKFDYDDNLVLYFLKNDELRSCQLESIVDANYEDDEGFTHIELTIQDAAEVL